MTLKTRNIFIKVFLILSLVLLAVSAAIFFMSLAKNSIIVPPDLRIPALLAHIPFAPNSLHAVFISIFVIILYVPVCFFLLLNFFENTQTSEIIFFTGFLFACLTEIARLITICIGLWQSFSSLLIFMGNIVLYGRTLAPLSFLCAALLSDVSERQDVERNYVIMIMVSLVFAAVVPMNTARITSTGLVTEGFMHLINIMRFIILVTTFLSFFIRGIKKNSGEYKFLALYSFVTLLGYSMLVTCDNFLFLILGTACLFFGTLHYLKEIHGMYMWG